MRDFWKRGEGKEFPNSHESIPSVGGWDKPEQSPSIGIHKKFNKKERKAHKRAITIQVWKKAKNALTRCFSPPMK